MRPHVPQEARTSAYGCGTRYPGRARRDGLHGWAARRRGPDGDTRGPRMGSVWSRRETGGDGLAGPGRGRVRSVGYAWAREAGTLRFLAGMAWLEVTRALYAKFYGEQAT
jgi:hypothetical protein